MTVVVLALVAGSFWATNLVAVRWALDRTNAPSLASAFVSVGFAAVGTAVLAAVFAERPAIEDMWHFALIGAIAPGSSQGLVVASIRRIGTSRTAVLTSTTPMMAVLLAIAVLDEQWRALVIIGTICTVAGSAVISWEPGRPGHHRGAVGLGLAAAATFAVRDVFSRKFGTDAETSVLWNATGLLVGAAFTLGMMSAALERRQLRSAIRTALPEFLLSSVAFAIAMTSLLAALDRGEIGLVRPLTSAAQGVVVIGLGAVVFGDHERSARVVSAIVLVVLGGTLVTIA